MKPSAPALVLWMSLSLALACRDRTQQAPVEPGSAQAFQEAHWDPAQIQRDDGQWSMATKAYDNHRFSSLSQITGQNVHELKLQWTFSTGTTKGNEAAPLVVGDTMYVVTPFPNVLYALDLGQPGAPVKWAYKPEPDAASQGVACCDVVNRGAAFAGGLVYFNPRDAQPGAGASATGKQVWRTP